MAQGLSNRTIIGNSIGDMFMENFNFFDSNIMIGPVRVPLKGQEYSLGSVLMLLARCGITGGLMYHSCSIESNPIYGNNRLVDDMASTTGFYPVWAALPLATMELSGVKKFKTELKRNNVKGVMLYPGRHGYIGSEWCCGDLYELLEGMRMPVFTRLLRETDFTWNQLHELLTDHPLLPVILRNVSYQIDRVAYKVLEKHENLYIDTRFYETFYGIEEVVRRFGAHRLIFGSGAPVMSAGAAVTPVMLSDIPFEEKIKIAGGNMLDLIGGIVYDV